jgi:protein-S-isoprenylcysteine O-methyltransferase Ste14
MRDIYNAPKLCDRLVFKVLAGTTSVCTFVAVFFLIAGRIDWIRGWAYVGLLTLGQTASAVYIWRKDPELLTMRSKIGEGTKKWDKILLGMFGIMYLGILIAAALDVRYNWSTMSIWLWPVGSVLYAFFIVIITWAMDVNRFFEKTVRIQTDRGHHVIDSGPYRIVRHPGYIATILGFIFSAPLLLGSWRAFIPAFLAIACLLIRTVLEDRTLQMELPGYKDYTKRVRYRLLPGIW